MEIYRLAICVVMLITAMWFDFKNRTIPNIIPASGIVVAIILEISNPVAENIYGALLPLILTPLFFRGIMGAGDIKLMCTIGALCGVAHIAGVIAYSFISGGVMALVILIYRKIPFSSFASLPQRIKSGEIRNQNKFPFSFAIFAGFLTEIIFPISLL